MNLIVKIDVSKCGSYSFTGALVKAMIDAKIPMTEAQYVHFIVEISCSETPRAGGLAAFLENVFCAYEKFPSVEFVEGK